MSLNSLDNIKNNILHRRTFAIISHPDAGKTTLTEKLLLFSGAILTAGTIKSKKSGKFATSDWMEIEKKRGISVASSVMQFEYKENIFNLLDTPGHEDFSEDTYRVLTAVDSALMVIDASKGVEVQTIKLLNTCRLRKTPIITFLNKYDREVKNTIDLLDEIEDVLKINCAPITWAIGMGKNFHGIYHILKDEAILYKNDFNNLNEAYNIIKGINNPKLDELFPLEIDQLRSEIELIKTASNTFDKNEFLNGNLTPIFCGSAINNFGINDILNALIDWAPCPLPRNASYRIVSPYEQEFSGFIFKIQANMDPKHRDRIAFLRICSGCFKRGMKIKHLRLNKELSTSNVVTFMSHNRKIVENAYAGDIIGIPNHGNIKIGDSFSEGEILKFTGIPSFAPEVFKRIQIKNPLKMKQLYKGLQQLGEEGAVQFFRPINNSDLIIGTIGTLQFEVINSRLLNEYQVETIFEPLNIFCARWIICDDQFILKEFEKINSINLSLDGYGNLAYLAPNKVNLELMQEKWSKIIFQETKEL